MRKIRVAQIGINRYSHGREIFTELINNSDIFEVAGYALPERERERLPEQVKIFEGYREMTVEEILSDNTIEAVTIETDEIYLTKYALMAARCGKHIHMEKPGGLSRDDFFELIKTVKENKTVFHIGYMYRYNPVIKEIIERAKSGEIGDIISVEAQMNCRHNENFTRWLSELRGGMMFYLGCHMIDIVLRLQGMPEKIIPYNKSSARLEGVDTMDNCFAVLEYKNGASFVKTTSAECGGYLRRNVVITGTKGRFEIAPLEVGTKNNMLYTEYSKCNSTEWSASASRIRSEEVGRYSGMMQGFAAMVRGEAENPYTYDYEAQLFDVLCECCK